MAARFDSRTASVGAGAGSSKRLPSGRVSRKPSRDGHAKNPLTRSPTTTRGNGSKTPTLRADADAMVHSGGFRIRIVDTESGRQAPNRSMASRMWSSMKMGWAPTVGRKNSGRLTPAKCHSVKSPTPLACIGWPV